MEEENIYLQMAHTMKVIGKMIFLLDLEDLYMLTVIYMKVNVIIAKLKAREYLYLLI